MSRTSSGRPIPVRRLSVAAVRRLTPGMVRVTLGGPDLEDLTLRGPDQQVKLLFPRPEGGTLRLPEPSPDGGEMGWYASFTAIPDEVRPWMRSYTLRSHDAAAGTADIDFVLHGAAEGGDVKDYGDGYGDGGDRGDDRGGGGDAVHLGPATRWAVNARPGDAVGMYGPSEYFATPLRISSEFGTGRPVLLAGDATALPAVGTILEHLPRGSKAVAFIEVADAAEELDPAAPEAVPEGVEVRWVHRGSGVRPGQGSALLDAVRGADLGAGPAAAWIAGEAGAVRSLRRHLVSERGMDKRTVDFTGYWRLRLTQDDDPTDEDMADARERVGQA